MSDALTSLQLAAWSVAWVPFALAAVLVLVTVLVGRIGR